MRPAEPVFFLLDEQLELWDKHWSERVAQYAVWLSGLMEFEEAERVLNQIGHILIWDTSVWRRTEKWGQRFQAEETAQRAVATAAPARGAPLPGDVRDLAHAVHTSYVAHRGGPDVFGEGVWAEARGRQWTRARDSIALGDGAPWIWNLVQTHFFDSRQAVDWYHAMEHLANTANLLKGEATPAAQHWRNAQATSLFEGHVEQLATRLLEAAPDHPAVAEGLRREAADFRDNHSRMQYQELREEGFPLGSGMVERGCKRFRARFNGADMRWSRPSLRRLIPIRAAILSRHFDHSWQTAYKSPRN